MNEMNEQELKQAAEQGMAVAQYAMGSAYRNGWGVEQDYQQAREWYLKAAAQSFAPALFALGSMYEEGQGERVRKPEPKF